LARESTAAALCTTTGWAALPARASLLRSIRLQRSLRVERGVRSVRCSHRLRGVNELELRGANWILIRGSNSADAGVVIAGKAAADQLARSGGQAQSKCRGARRAQRTSWQRSLARADRSRTCAPAVQAPKEVRPGGPCCCGVAGLPAASGSEVQGVCTH
jgi:hypothetical protein